MIVGDRISFKPPPRTATVVEVLGQRAMVTFDDTGKTQSVPVAYCMEIIVPPVSGDIFTDLDQKWAVVQGGMEFFLVNLTHAFTYTDNGFGSIDEVVQHFDLHPVWTGENIQNI